MTTLYSFQQEALRWCNYFEGRVLLALEPGLGKTAIALTWAAQNVPDGPVVVVCPASVKIHWQREAQTHIGWNSVVLEGTQPPPALEPSKLYILNYDILRPWMPLLEALRPKLLIVDESHYIKDPTTLRSRLVKQLGWPVPHIFCLSGTPLVNRPIELFPTLHLLAPEVYRSRWSFALQHAAPRRTPWGWRFDGAEKLDLLHRNLKQQMMIRMRKADVLKELPAKTRHIVPLPLSDPKEYHQAETDFLAWLRKTHGNVSSARRAERLTRYNGLKKLAGELKLPAVQEWVHNFFDESEGKLILFGVHRAVVGALHQHFTGSVLVNGSVTGKNRQQAIDQFSRVKECRLFVGNVQAAGTGWNGSVAGDVAFAELGWTPGEMTQAEDRPHRIGQKEALNIWFLIAENTIEEQLCQLLTRKQEILDQTLDGRAVPEGLNLQDLLEERLLHQKGIVNV